MPIDIFETRTMTEALEQMKPPQGFLQDMFFRDEELHDTVTVDIDVIKGARRMAPFVSPVMEGKLVEDRGYATSTITPPYIKDKRVTTAQKLLDRRPGETVYAGGKSPLQRASEKLGRDLADQENMIFRREEWMVAQALFTGAVTCTGEGVSIAVDFQMESTHKVTLAGNDCWDQTESTPLDDMRTWKRLIVKDSGLNPDTAVFGSAAVDAFLNHADVQDLLDNRRIALGQIDPRLLPQNATYYGHINELGLDIYGYDEWYLDDSGVEQPMVPTKKVMLGSTQARCTRHYAMIQDMDAIEAQQWAVKRYVKSWTEPDPGVRYLLMQSAPLPAPHQIDAFLTAQVIA